MKHEMLNSFLIVYSAVYILYMGFQIFSYIKFRVSIRNNHLVSLLDHIYEAAICIVGFVYTGIYISGLADSLTSTRQYNEWKLPFVIYAMPLMVITFKILIMEGLYAYNGDKIFVGGSRSYDRDNVKIDKVYTHPLTDRANIIVTANAENRMKEKKFVIRTSLNNLQPFVEVFGK